MFRPKIPISLSECGEGTDDGNHQTHHQRHPCHGGCGDVGIEASGNRSRQERESGKSSYRDTSVHQILKPQPVLIIWPWNIVIVPDGINCELPIIQSTRSHNPIIQRSVLSSIAIREATKGDDDAKDDEEDNSPLFMTPIADSVVRCQGC